MDARLALHYCLLALDFDGSDMEVHWASFRLTACKVLDVYTVSQDDSHLPAPESSTDRKLAGAEAAAGEGNVACCIWYWAMGAFLTLSDRDRVYL